MHKYSARMQASNRSGKKGKISCCTWWYWTKNRITDNDDGDGWRWRWRQQHSNSNVKHEKVAKHLESKSGESWREKSQPAKWTAINSASQPASPMSENFVSQSQETFRRHTEKRTKSQYTRDKLEESMQCNAVQCAALCFVCASRNRTPNYFCVNCCLSRVCPTNLSFCCLFAFKYMHWLYFSFCVFWVVFSFCFGLLCKRHFHSKSEYIWSKLHILFIIVVWRTLHCFSFEIFHPICWGAVTVLQTFFIHLLSELIYQTDFITHLTQDSNNLLLLLLLSARSVSCCYRYEQFAFVLFGLLACLLQTEIQTKIFTQMQRKICRDAIPMWFEIAIHSKQNSKNNQNPKRN